MGGLNKKTLIWTGPIEDQDVLEDFHKFYDGAMALSGDVFSVDTQAAHKSFLNGVLKDRGMYNCNLEHMDLASFFPAGPSRTRLQKYM